jgi:signal transduction histidine kinase
MGGGYARIGDPLPELARDRRELARALAGTPTASQVLFEHDGRSFKTGYAPVWLDGQVVAVVLAEAPAEWFATFHEFRTSLLVAGLCAAVAIGLVAFLFARTLAAPIRRLAAAARRIGGGDLATPVGAAGADELRTLARTVDEMREALHARERQLQVMLAGIAHEVRNPLGGMDLYSGLLLEELADRPLQAGHVRRIRREIDGLSRLVGDFLDWAREKPPAPEARTARSLLEETASLLAAQAGARGVTLEVEGDAALRCDPALLRRALLNLGKNAIEAAPAGTRVRLVAAEPGGGRVRLAVADGGAGVPAELVERIFEPFFSTKERGTGLGLAFVRKIAVAHGGTARVEPTPGGGATFVLDLPAAGPAAPARSAG